MDQASLSQQSFHFLHAELCHWYLSFDITIKPWFWNCFGLVFAVLEVFVSQQSLVDANCTLVDLSSCFAPTIIASFLLSLCQSAIMLLTIVFPSYELLWSAYAPCLKSHLKTLQPVSKPKKKLALGLVVLGATVLAKNSHVRISMPSMPSIPSSVLRATV